MNRNTTKRILLPVALIGSLFVLLASGASLAEMGDTIEVAVKRTETAPVIDGDAGEWGAGWQRLPVKPATKNDKKNHVGDSEVEFQAVTSGDRLFVVARWPDSRADTQYKRWTWQGKRYRRSKERDDMFALRFDMGGSYDDCMLSKKTYAVDVWLWSAARTNDLGLAEDMNQQMSTQVIEDAAEYEADDGTTIYIKKRKDAGSPIYVNNKIDRKKKQGDRVKSIKPGDNPGGSIADVQAKATWKDGHWLLEMSRKLDTGHKDDRQLKLGETVLGAIAVFDRAGAEHKSNSPTLAFVFQP